MEDFRKVKFNVAIAEYRPGQIVNYSDMPLGHRFWVDNNSILEATRICEFVKAEEKPKIVITKSLDMQPDPYETAKRANEMPLETSEPVVSPPPKRRGRPSVKKEKSEEPLFQNVDGTAATCPGVNKDGTKCNSTKLMLNGYCYFHQHQAPTGLTGEMPEGMKAVQGL